MTTGSKSVGSISTGSYGFSKAWNGGDGKYEIVKGRKRAKWNAYFSTRSEQWSKPRSSDGIYVYNICASSTDLFNLWLNNDQLNLLGKLTSKVKQSDFNLAVNVAQGKQLVDMLHLNIGKIGGALVDLRRGDFASAARRLGVKKSSSRLRPDDISGRWLELQYGWLPAIGDSYEAAKAYENLTAGHRSMTVRVSHSTVSLYNQTASPSSYTGWGRCRSKRTIIAELTEDISAARKLGLVDPLTVAWEIVPYSFVIDWFLPVGSYLENLNVIPKLNGRFLTSHTVDYSNKAAVIQPVAFPPNWNGASQASCTRAINRTVNTALAVPSPNFVSLPDAMSPKRIFNAVALIHQLLRFP